MVARAFAEGRGIADAYQVGQGPTAHLLPTAPAIAGLIYRLFGIDSAAAKSLLTAWSIGCALGSYLLFYRAFAILGMARSARLAALAFLCLFPAYITQEAIDFRAWEGALTVLLGAAFLTCAAAAVRDGLNWASATLLAVVAAAAFFMNPVYGLGLYAAGMMLATRQWPIGRVILLMLVCASTLAVLIVPWTLRNERLLGHAVMLRSNGGLELALANRSDAVDGHDQAARYYAQLNTIHPHSSMNAYRRMQAVGGEVVYARMLGRETATWMMANPFATARLMLRHVLQLFAPPPWAFSQLDGGFAGVIKSVLASTIGILGLIGLLWRLGSSGPNWLIAGCLILIPALLVSPFQPIARYCYLIFAISAFFAADCLQRLSVKWSRRPLAR